MALYKQQAEAEKQRLELLVESQEGTAAEAAQQSDNLKAAHELVVKDLEAKILEFQKREVEVCCVRRDIGCERHVITPIVVCQHTDCGLSAH